METLQIVILAIVVILALLVIVLAYIFLGGKNDAPHTPKNPADDAKKTPSAAKVVPTAAARPSAPTAREPQAPRTQEHDTPPAGISRSDLRGLLTDPGTAAPLRGSDATPAGGMDSFKPKKFDAASDTDTAPQPTLSANEITAGDPPRKRTVALNASAFLNDDTNVVRAPAPPARPPARTRTTGPSTALPDAPSGPRLAAPAPPSLPRTAPAPPAASMPFTAVAPPTPSVAPAVPAPTTPAFQPAAPSVAPAPPAVTPPITPPIVATPAPAENAGARFRDRNASPQARVDAFHQLLQRAEPDERLLIVVEAINDDNLELQLVALQEITKHSDGNLLDEVIPLIESDSQDVALAAVKALENIGGPVVEQAFLAAVECPHVAVQTYAIQALAAGINPLLEEQLHDMLNEDDTHLIQVAARVLAEVGGEESAELLRTRASMMTSGDPLHQPLMQAAEKAAAKPRTSGAGFGSDPFAHAEPVDFDGSGDLEEFELSLDPELFNPKN